MGIERDRAAPPLTGAAGRAIRLPLAAVLAVVTLASCGGSSPAEPPTGDGARSDGVLRWALPSLGGTTDPLAATTPESRLIVRQIFEPLTGAAQAPFDGRPRRPLLAVSASSSEGGTTWRLRLRRGVRFTDGAPFNAAAVLANAQRWLADERGRRLIGNVVAIDAPAPFEVRFITSAPAPDMLRRLMAPELGIVSPEGLEQLGAGDEAAGAQSHGTGPFVPAGRSETSLELGPNPNWWGANAGIAPALRGVVLIASARPGGRLALLESGGVRVATLNRDGLRRALADPLIRRIGPDTVAELSVRALRAGTGAPQLSGVWLTAVGI